MTEHDPLCHASKFEYHDPECCDCRLIAKVRADERERHTVNNPMLLADLRVKVEALPPHGQGERMFVWRDDVLALIDGGTP